MKASSLALLLLGVTSQAVHIDQINSNLIKKEAIIQQLHLDWNKKEDPEKDLLHIEAYPIHQDTTLSEESEKIKICASILESWTKMDKEDFKATILDKSAASKV